MKIKLSSDVSIDLDKLIESRALFQANSGGGKSWALRRFIEQTFGKKQIVIIDPEGEFGNMRKEFDFVYVGKDGDAPAEPRSAALLARRLLETKANAIIDIYELGSKRSDFVKLFFEAVVNMPKELWTDCFFILDEAHKFAPEKGQGESVALSAVIDMASLGRKRGYCLIPATQRPAKLSKDVVAECNNKLIGRASLDIDRKRSADELGFRDKEEILSLRNLAPGEFYAFGPAISNDVIKTTVGDVSVKPPKRGTGRSLKIAPPTAKVKAILAKLADLPQAAEEEARTAAELKGALAAAKRRISELERAPAATKQDPDALKKVTDKAYSLGAEATRVVMKKEFADTEKWYQTLLEIYRSGLKIIAAQLDDINTKIDKRGIKPLFSSGKPLVVNAHSFPKIFENIKEKISKVEPIKFVLTEDAQVGKGEMAVLNAIAQIPEGITNEHLAILTGYRSTSRRVYTNNLARVGYIEKRGDLLIATQAGIDALGAAFVRLPEGPELREHFLSTLPEGEQKIFRFISDAHPEPVTRQQIEESTQYKTTSVRVYVNKLIARKAIANDGMGSLRLHEKLL